MIGFVFGIVTGLGLSGVTLPFLTKHMMDKYAPKPEPAAPKVDSKIVRSESICLCTHAIVMHVEGKGYCTCRMDPPKSDPHGSYKCACKIFMGKELSTKS